MPPKKVQKGVIATPQSTSLTEPQDQPLPSPAGPSSDVPSRKALGKRKAGSPPTTDAEPSAVRPRALPTTSPFTPTIPLAAAAVSTVTSSDPSFADASFVSAQDGVGAQEVPQVSRAAKASRPRRVSANLLALEVARSLGADTPDDYFDGTPTVKFARLLNNSVVSFGLLKHLSDSIHELQEQVISNAVDLREFATEQIAGQAEASKAYVEERLQAMSKSFDASEVDPAAVDSLRAIIQTNMEDVDAAFAEGQSQVANINSSVTRLQEHVDQMASWLNMSASRSLHEAVGDIASSSLSTATAATARASRMSAALPTGVLRSGVGPPPPAMPASSGQHSMSRTGPSSSAPSPLTVPFPARSAAIPHDPARQQSRAAQYPQPIPDPSSRQGAPTLRSAFRMGPLAWKSDTAKAEMKNLFHLFTCYALVNEDYHVNIEEGGRFLRVTFPANAHAGTMFKDAFDENQHLMPETWAGKGINVAVCTPRRM